MNSTLKGLRPASACAPNEFGLQGPSADGRLYASNEFDLEGPLANGRPAPTEKYSSRRRRPTLGAKAPRKADFNRRKASGQRSACASNEFDLEGLRPTVGLRRPTNTLRVGEGRRLARKRLRRPISIGAKASGQRSACASNEFDLEGLRPTVGLRRPKNTLRVGEGRRPARKRLGRPISIGAKPPASGRPAPTEKYSPRRRRPTPGA